MSDKQVRLYESTPTSEQLLRAARAEFAERGLGGGRVNRIAESAGVNKERIYAYFGSKEQLFDIVISVALEELVEAVPLNPGDDIVEHVLATFEYHQRHPELLRLLLWEALHYADSEPPHNARRVELYRRKVAALGEIIGTTTQDETALTLFALTGLAAWPNAMLHLGAIIAGKPISDRRSRQAMRTLITGMATAMTAPPG